MEKSYLFLVGWMLLGQLALFGAIYTHDVIIYFVGTIGATLGTLGQKYVGQILASPYKFGKAIRRSFVEDYSVVEQIRYEKPPTTIYGKQKCGAPECKDKVVDYLDHRARFPSHANLMTAIAPNWSVFKLEDPYKHKKYGPQDLLILEHMGEFEEQYPPEPGDVAFAGAPDVKVNTCPIMDLWETPRTYQSPDKPLHIYPIHVPAMGAPGAYKKWVHSQVAQTAEDSKKELAAFLR